MKIARTTIRAAVPIPRVFRWTTALGIGLLAGLTSASDQPVVHVAPMNEVGPRQMEQQTQNSVIRDYLLAWQTLSSATAQNQPQLLDNFFIGNARQTLAETIRDEQRLGLTTSYSDRSHDIKVIFYSPEGLSIQLIDNVEYDVEIRDSSHSLGVDHVHAQYVAVLSPTESQWKVRILEGGTGGL